MTLNQLQYFYHAATLEHFNQAAEKANISEPTLSRSISTLEDELGLILFEKKGRNVKLTKAGSVFLEHVTRILDEVNRTEQKMQQLATNGGRVDIAYVAPLARTFIPKTVHTFLHEEENRHVIFNFHQGHTQSNIDGLKRGIYDLIFGSKAENEPEIQFVPILKQEMVVILPSGHELATAPDEKITSALFGLYPVLSYDQTSGLGKYTKNFFLSHGIHPEFICESPDENGIASLVAHGFGIALVADVDTIYRDDICIRPLVSNESFSHTVYMGYIRGKYQLPAVQRFIEFVKQHG